MPERAPALVASVVLALGVVCAIALRWPAVHAGYQDDDYIQAAMLEGAFWIERGPLDLFWFSGRDAAEQRALMDHGYLPWWTDPEHRVGMMRPFASGLLALEHALGLTPVAQHLVALGLFALCVLAAYRLLRALLPPWIAVLGTLMYALDEAHGAPTAWLANRSTLISTLLAFLALASYVRARSEPGAHRAPLARAFALLALAFVSGEYGYFALGYIAAFELLGPVEGSWRAPLAALSLAAAVSAVAALLGYGVVSSGYYISPFRDAARFADATITRLPALVFDLLLGIPSRWVQTGWPLRDIALERGWLDAQGWYELPSYYVVASFAVWLALAALYFTVRALARDSTLAPLRYLVLGACLALIPAAGALPSPRLTGGSALGFAALFAALLVHAARYVRRALLTRAPGTSIPRGVAAMLVVLGVAFTHGILPADRARADAQGSAHRAHSARKWALEADVPAQLSPDTQVWLASASDFTTASHVPWARWRSGLPRIERFRLLSGAARAHDLFRIDDRTLEVQVLSSDAGRAFMGSLYRAETAPFRVGDEIRLPGVVVRVLIAVDGDPLRLRFTADRSLDDATIVLLCPEPSGIRRCAMPAPGYALRLPRAPLPWGDPKLRYAKTVRRFIPDR
jgi:hypothetical protein